jgi:hypothetical protein
MERRMRVERCATCAFVSKGGAMGSEQPEERKKTGNDNLMTGIGVGVAIGAGIGLLLDNLAMGIGIGIALGISIGMMLDNQRKSG